VAVFLKTDVTSWDDNKSLFQLAEDEFGGVDVSPLSTVLTITFFLNLYLQLEIACMNAGIGEVPESIFSPLEGM
jgi:NAD(P)-dependent dehydrogenase (short-subunit alcohol dehydrogenase family)